MSNGEETPRRIVVGFDTSAASVEALQWALAQAQVTGAIVEAVIAWDIYSGFGSGPTVVDGEDMAGAAQQSLAAAVEKVSAAYPGVVVEQRVLRGHPAAVLIDRASGADLLVVGSHGYGGFVGALLGSVSQHCVHHATCPVVVVRAEH
ncbi:universal stress protein [Luedemannella flava]|uniref:Universal stress protein n=1 Tax=Luedemannella flava TaxID=349316 RepID=A0ABN2M120_9ACTN